MVWRALVGNGSFLEVLDTHRARMVRDGLEVIPTGDMVGNLPPEQVYALGREADVIFGPCGGLDARLFQSAPRLKVVALASSGYDSVRVTEATSAGIVVTHAPVPALAEAVADVAWGLMLAVARDIPNRHHRLMYQHHKDRTMGRGLWGKTLGTVGLGHIGQMTARRATGFAMCLLAWNRSWSAEHEAFATRYGVRRVELDTLLRESDVVSLHLRETPETRHIIGARELALMKPTAMLINTARANLVDDAALHHALTHGQLFGAGLDTVADGGLDSPLLGLPNVVGLPHLGNRVVEAMDAVAEATIDDALAVLRGQRPSHVVNPEVYATLQNR